MHFLKSTLYRMFGSSIDLELQLNLVQYILPETPRTNDAASNAMNQLHTSYIHNIHQFIVVTNGEQELILCVLGKGHIIMYNCIRYKLYITQKTGRKTNFHNTAWQRVHNNRTQPTHRNIAPCLVLLPTLVGTEPVNHLVPHGIAHGSPFYSSPNVREGAGSR